MTAPTDPARRLRRARTEDLTTDERGVIRTLLRSAFEGDGDRFSESDWDHAIGGIHIVLEQAGRIASHASVVERNLRIGDLALRTGYVEAVATTPGLQRQGLGSAVMADASAWIGERFELGALSTGRPSFYERLGWRRWRGPSFVDGPAGLKRTPDDDGSILVLATPTSPAFDSASPITCDWRDGDVW